MRTAAALVVSVTLSCLWVFCAVVPVQAAIQCYDCHGTKSPADYRPVDAPFRNFSTGGFPGNHRSHMSAPASPGACASCHPGSDTYTTGHRDGFIKLSPNLNSSPVAARYKNSTSAFPQSTNAVPGTCSNVNCHFETTTPPWGSARFSGAAACSRCHAAPPNDGTHKQHDDYYGPGPASCGRCHADHAASPSPFAHATSAGKRGLYLKGFDYSKPENTAYPKYLLSQTPSGNRNGICNNISCHGNTSAGWGGTSSALCLDCHSIRQGNRAAITPQFGASSHHVQGTVTNSHCFQCHWEANSDGTINSAYHHSKTPGAPVELVIYGAGSRPVTYTAGSTAEQYTANGTRGEIQKISRHCLGCHSDQNNGTVPFGDGKTPKQYAWDGTSVAARYGQTATTTWGKYSTVANAAQKRASKALSAHGNAAGNKRGWNTVDGVDGAIPNTSGGVNVECFDCHNSHGSTVAGSTTRYVSATANGGILKDTTVSPNGYSVAYKPYSGGSAASKTKRGAGASLCLDCHLNQNATATPWGYTSTFGASQGILGYWDAPMYGSFSTAGAAKRSAYKKLNPVMGGHYGASSNLSGTPTSGIGGLCTPCHDPHGVSPTLGTNQQYAVPLLKGTWLTSPYKEDMAPRDNTVGTVLQADWGNGAYPYKIDQNTFASGGVTEPVSVTGGLCIGCHPQSSLTNGTNHTWRSKDRIHESVAGWKTAGGTVKHGYTCSKCHAPHTNSTLPRLMVTNCLDGRHKGQLGLNSAAVLTGSGSGSEPGCDGAANDLGFCYATGQGSGSGQGRIPGNYAGSNAYSNLACHEGQNGSGTDQRWNDVTPWTNATPVISAGPSASVGGIKFLLHMDEAAWNGTRNEVIDSSGANNHGTSSNATTVDGGVTGRAGSFNGSTSAVTVNFASGSVPMDSFTLEAWVKPSATHEVEGEYTSGTGGTYGQRYLFWPDQMGPVNGGAGVSVGTNGISVYEHGDNYMPALAVYSGSISSTQWTHVAIVYANKRPSIYVNGTLVRTGLQSLRAHVYAPRILGGDVYGHYAGLMDDVAVYDGALPASDILLHSQLKCGNLPASPAATIYWSTDYSYSTSYVDYGPTSAYGLTVGNDALVTSHTVVLQNLTNNTTYHYRVRSREAGGKEVVSGDYSFTTAQYCVSASPPAAPTLVPQSGSTTSGGSITKTFQWSAVTSPDRDGVQYLAEVSSASDFTAINYTSGWQAGTSWSQSLPTGTWYWRVTARDSVHTAAVSPASSANSFSITYANPSAPILTTQGTSYVIGSGSTIPIAFQWSAVTVADGDPVNYQAVVSSSSTFSSIAYQSSWQTGVTWSQALPVGTWYWKVTARDSLHTGASSTSATGSFSIVDRTPAVPTLADQGNVSTSGSASIAFSWNSVPSPDGDAVQYQVDVSTYSSFATIGYQSSWQTATSWTQSLGAGTWYSRVRARDSVHTTAVSGYSPTDTFTISNPTSQSWTTPGSYAWTVPAGVTSATISARGAGGAGGMYDLNENQQPGVNGNFVSRTIAVTPGEQLTIYVGGGGHANGYDYLGGGAGGFGYHYGSAGGAGQGQVGGDYSYGGGGGGGSSAVVRGTSPMVEAAGGAGGRSSDYYSYDGGAGGAGGGADYPATTVAGGGGTGGGDDSDGGNGSVAVSW